VPNPKSLNKRLYEAIPLGGWLFFIEKKYITSQESKVLDFATSAIYGLSKSDTDMETLSILNVCGNVTTNEKIDEAIRQSGSYRGSCIDIIFSYYVFCIFK